MLYPPEAFNLKLANLSCNSVLVKTTPKIMLSDDSVTQLSNHSKHQPVSGGERSSVPQRRHRSDVFTVAENPLLNNVDRVTTPRECIIYGHQAKEGRELRWHLLARHHVVGPIAQQRGLPFVLTRATLRYIEDPEELNVLFDKFFTVKTKRRKESREKGQATSPAA